MNSPSHLASTRCVSCDQTFTPRVSFHKTCLSCHRLAIVAPKIAPKITAKLAPKLTSTPLQIAPKSCSYCDQTFVPTDRYGADKSCERCAIFVDDLHAGKLVSDKVYPGYILEVEYSIIEDSHSGYCSDQEETKTKTYNEIKRFQVPRFFVKNDFKDDDTIDLYRGNKKLRFFKRETSGCCGCCGSSSTTYSVVKAKLKEIRARDKLFG